MPNAIHVASSASVLRMEGQEGEDLGQAFCRVAVGNRQAQVTGEEEVSMRARWICAVALGVIAAMFVVGELLWVILG